MLVMGLLFLNVLILLSILTLFLLLLYQAISFRRRINLLKRSVKVGKRQEQIEAVAGNEMAIDVAIANESGSSFRIVRFTPDIPSIPLRERNHHKQLSLASRSEQRIVTVLTPNSPGRFELLGWIAVVEDRGRLFTQNVSLDDRITILVHPAVNHVTGPIDTGVFYDVAVDKLRRGRGTDLVGIRPFNFLDDFHRIDWKATARRGEMMARDFYLERDPTVILVIDISIEDMIHGTARASRFLDEMTALLSSFQPSVPLGLILCNRNRVVSTIESSVGQTTRKRILRELLEVSNFEQVTSPSFRGPTKFHASIAGDMNDLKEALNLSDKTHSHWNRIRMFSEFILPFYERSMLRHLKRISGEGVFHAFELICSLPSPGLVISITDGRTNLEGLSEGAKRAVMMNHKVILAIFDQHGADESAEVFSEIERHGVRILKIGTDVTLWKAVASEILTMSHSRIIESRTVP